MPESSEPAPLTFLGALRRVLPAYAATRAILLVVGVLAPYLLPFNTGMAARSIVFKDGRTYSRYVDIWTRFDSQWYLWIVEKGYADQSFHWSGTNPSPPFPVPPQTGFFPLYPLLIKALTPALKSPPLAGVVISNLCLLLTAAFMVLLGSKDSRLGKEASNLGVFFLLAFPTSFFLSSVYAESLFIFFCVFSFLMARTNRFWIAGLSGFLAASTKPLGALLLIPLLLEWWKARKLGHASTRSLPAVLLCPAGMLSFFLYCGIVLGDPLLPVKRQTWWRGGFDWPWNTFQDVINNPYPLGYSNSIWDAAVCLFALVMLFFAIKALNRSLLVWTLMMVLIPLTGGPISYGRLFLAAWPLFLVLGKLCTGRPRVLEVFSAIFLILSGFFFCLFSLYNWID